MRDLDGRIFERRGDHFVPGDYGALEMVQSVPEGKQVLLYHRTPRSPKNHAHYRSILAKAVPHLEIFNDVENLHDAVKIAVGHTRPVYRKIPGSNDKWEIIMIPDTTNFAAMTEDEFKRYKNRALYVLTDWLGFDAIELVKQAEQQDRPNR